MKILLLIRHAHSFPGASETDLNRPLSAQGRRDAASMAQVLQHKNIVPDMLVASTAKRALETARAMASVWDYPPQKIRAEKGLYESSFLGYDDIIGSIADEYDRIALIGHNPVIVRFVNSLTSFSTDRFPPCSVAAFRIHTRLWNDFQLAEKEFLFLESPQDGKA